MSEEKAYGGQLIFCPTCKLPNTFTETLRNDYLDKHICDGCGWANQYPGGVSLYSRCVYTTTCECGREHFVTTQTDNSPEYYTEVGVLCGCGELVQFNLPVN